MQKLNYWDISMQTIILKHSVQNCKEINGEQIKETASSFRWYNKTLNDCEETVSFASPRPKNDQS